MTILLPRSNLISALKMKRNICCNYSHILRSIYGKNVKYLPHCCFSTTNRYEVPLIKETSKFRADWERARQESDDKHLDSFRDNFFSKQDAYGIQSGFGKPQASKSKIGLKYVGKLQSISKTTSSQELKDLFTDISRHIEEFTAYELIDIGYYLTRVNRQGCSEVVEPILHRFFSLPERYSCLNGVYIHRLLRTMFIFQDVTYRVWVYDVAKIVGSKHQHLLMRDIQLVIDDLSLFYDAAAQGALALFEPSVINRAHQLELYRLPLVIHALGRCGYNSIDVAKAIHNVYINKRNHPDYYLCHLIGLLLKGYCAFHFHPGRMFLHDVWLHIKNDLKVAEFKYISWIAESFLKLRYVENVPSILDELIAKHHLLSHLEFTDFITDCWSIQSYILAIEFEKFVIPGTIWQENHMTPDSYDHERVLSDLSKDVSGAIKEKEIKSCDKITGENEFEKCIAARENQDNNCKKGSESIIMTMYAYYGKLISLILEEMPEKVYKSTPPYRATQFELLTRLLVFYPNPRDFKIILPLRKFDATYPLMQTNTAERFKPGDLNHLFMNFTHLSASRFFGDCHTPNSVHKGHHKCVSSRDASECNDSTQKMSEEELCGISLDSKMDLELRPLHDLLKQYLHSLFFRTPALAPRGLRLLIEGLVRIHFEKREDCVLDPDLLPSMKTKFYERPLSRAIVREVYRKLACYNTDDLLVSLFGMFVLNMFELEMAPTLLSQLTEMWLHHKIEKVFSRGQLDTIVLFYKTLEVNMPVLYSSIEKKSVDMLVK